MERDCPASCKPGEEKREGQGGGEGVGGNTGLGSAAPGHPARPHAPQARHTWRADRRERKSLFSLSLFPILPALCFNTLLEIFFFHPFRRKHLSCD